MNEEHSLQLSENVLLWDGKMYPRARVEQELVGLSDYAAEHDALTETAPSRLGSSIIRTAIMYLWCGIIFTAVLLFASGNLILSIITSAVLTIITAALFGWQYIWLTQRARSTVIVKEGKVILQMGLGRCTFTWPLDAFQWYEGKARHDSMLKSSVYPNIRTLVLVTRTKIGWLPARRDRIACGFTSETRARWEAFLALAEIPRGRSGRQIVRPLREKRKST